MVKQLLLILFAICVGSIFIELGRMLANIRQITSAEWIGFFIFIGVAIWVWTEGKKMDSKEKNQQEDKTKALVKGAIKEALKEYREDLNKR